MIICLTPQRVMQTSTNSQRWRIRRGALSELEAINGVIAAAVGTWRVSERVKRLAVPLYCYEAGDLDHMAVFVAEDDAGKLLGIATLEHMAPNTLHGGLDGLLLHGLFVLPGASGKGIGAELMKVARGYSAELGCDGFLVKAAKESAGYFAHAGLQPLRVTRPEQDYPHRFWQTV